MTALRLATWNVNSVRLRLPQIARFLADTPVDILCLQETKVRDEEFPAKGFAELGFTHLAHIGQKGLHGVAIASRLPLKRLDTPPLCPREEPRAIVAEVAGLEVHNLYVPAGGDEPDTEINWKFAHKLDFVARMKDYYAGRAKTRDNLVLVGDLNIAPLPEDVWSHKQLLDVVSHTPVETDGLLAVLNESGLIDVVRQARPQPEQVFTWWSYRAADWTKNNRGRRLDHVWASPGLASRMAALGVNAATIQTATRHWERPSDHVPIVVEIPA